jgi:hypothetical protein
MANIARTNGFTISSTGTVESFIGKAPQFLAVVVKDSGNSAVALTGEFGPEGGIDQINRLITGGDANASIKGAATIHAIQYNATGQLSYMLEGSVGNWTAATLQTAIRAMSTAGNVDCSGSTVTDVGFKLALS